MDSIEYKVSTNWKDNLTETAHTIIEEQKEKINQMINGINQIKYMQETNSEAKTCGLFGLQKKIITTTKIKYYKN